MPLKTLPTDEPSINLISMLDVLLFLVMFFMIGTQFAAEERQYDIQLPTVADATALTGQPDAIVVNVSAAGAVTVRSENKTLTELAALLQEARTRFPGQAVIIRGDGAGRYQLVMDVMSTCRQAGIRSISLAHKPGDAAP